MRAPGSYKGLTVMQAGLLSFLRYEAEEGYTPSFEEIRAAFGLASKSSVHRLVEGLEERGYVQRLPYRSRSLIVFDEPQTIGLCKHTTAELLDELASRGLQVSVG